jgi:ribosomal protein L34E
VSQKGTIKIIWLWLVTIAIKNSVNKDGRTPLNKTNMGIKTQDKEPATCRGCGRVLKGNAYMYGGSAYHPVTNENCPVNQYGGFVCSEQCDIKACKELEGSMPGNTGSGSLSTYALNKIRNNWRK